MKPSTVPADVITALARRRMTPSELHSALWIVANQGRGRRFFSREVAASVGLTDNAVRNAIADLIEQGVIENADPAQTQGRPLRVVLDPTAWKPKP